MDFWISAGISALLEVIANKKARPKWYRALAKIYVAIENAAAVDSGLREAIDAKKALT